MWYINYWCVTIFVIINTPNWQQMQTCSAAMLYLLIRYAECRVFRLHEHIYIACFFLQTVILIAYVLSTEYRVLVDVGSLTVVVPDQGANISLLCVSPSCATVSVIVQLQSSCPFCDVAVPSFAMPSFWLSFSQSCALDWSQFYMFLSCWFSYLSYIVLYCRIAHFIRKCHRFNILTPSFVWWFILWSSGSVPSDNERSVRQMIYPTYRADLKFTRFLCPTQQLEGRPHRINFSSWWLIVPILDLNLKTGQGRLACVKNGVLHGMQTSD